MATQATQGETQPLLGKAGPAVDGGGGGGGGEATTSDLEKLDNLASGQYRLGKYIEAEELLRRAYNMRVTQLGENHPDTLLNLNNLAASLGRLGRFAEAEESFRRALEGRKTSKGSEHADTLTTMNHLGVLLKQQGRFADAEGLLESALNGFSKVLGEEHLCTAESAYNYAVLCVQQGKRRKAGRLFGRSLKGLTKALGADHQHTLDALHWDLKCKEGLDASALEAGNDEKEAEVPYVSRSKWAHATACEICAVTYTLMRREHHCRLCSRSVCSDCSPNRTLILEFDANTPQRYCAVCEQQGF